MKSYIKVLRNYVVFSGRATRQEYWMFQLINFLIVMLLWALQTFILVLQTKTDVYSVLTFIYGFGVMLPSIAVQVRRLHDTGRSGWWWLLNFLPIIGGLVLIVFSCLDSEPKDNQYGLNPKKSSQL